MLIGKAIEVELLNPIVGCTSVQRVSIYANDVVLFIKPNAQDLVTVKGILHVFGEASGLKVNYGKSTTTLIRGDEQDDELVHRILHCPWLNSQSNT